MLFKPITFFFMLWIFSAVRASQTITLLYPSVEACKDTNLGYGGQCTLNTSCVGSSLYVSLSQSATCTLTNVGSPVTMTVLGASTTMLYYEDEVACNKSLATQSSSCSSGAIVDQCHTSNFWTLSKCLCGNPSLTVALIAGLDSLTVLSC